MFPHKGRVRIKLHFLAIWKSFKEEVRIGFIWSLENQWLYISVYIYLLRNNRTWEDFKRWGQNQIDIPLSSVVKEQVRCQYWLPKQGPSEMPLIWTITLLSLTQMLHIFLSQFMGTDLWEPKGLRYMCQGNISLAYKHILIKTFLQWAL